MSSDDSAIVVDKVFKSVGDTLAIKSLDTRISRGRLTGLVGPDGAGKTTLMRMLASLMYPDSGRVVVDGHDVAPRATLYIAVGYMPQRFGLYEDLSVAQNLRLYADLKGLVGTERQQIFEKLLEFTRLGPFVIVWPASCPAA